MDSQKACKECGETFFRHKRAPGRNKLSDKQWLNSKYCSMKCAGLSLSKKIDKKRPPLKEKFESFFKKTDGCWEWTGTIEGYGYGVIDWKMKRYRAHVLALHYDGRPVPKGMVARHICDKPKCVRPSHLCIGTVKQNAEDAKERGRLKIGEDSPVSKLTEKDVREMRALNLSHAEIARRYNVSRPTAARAIKGLTWGHVK